MTPKTVERPADAPGIAPEPGAGEAWREAVGDLPHHGLGDGGDDGDTGEPIEPLYADVPDGLELGLPGQAPFVRGAYKSGYVKRPWLMVQYAGFGTVSET